jgi:hypothetical protein
MQSPAEAKGAAYETAKAALDAKNAPPEEYAALAAAFFGSGGRAPGRGVLITPQTLVANWPVVAAGVAGLAFLIFEGPQLFPAGLFAFRQQTAQTAQQEAMARYAEQKAKAEAEAAQLTACRNEMEVAGQNASGVVASPNCQKFAVRQVPLSDAERAVTEKTLMEQATSAPMSITQGQADEAFTFDVPAADATGALPIYAAAQKFGAEQNYESALHMATLVVNAAHNTQAAHPLSHHQYQDYLIGIMFAAIASNKLGHNDDASNFQAELKTIPIDELNEGLRRWKARQ